MPRGIVVVHRANAPDLEFTGDTVGVDGQGTLIVQNTELTAKTTTHNGLWGRSETATEISKQLYTSAVFASGCWTAAYAKVARIESLEVTEAPSV